MTDLGDTGPGPGPGPTVPDGATSVPPAAGTLAASAGWNVMAQLAPAAVSILLTPYLVHGIGVAQFGIYSIALTLSLFVGTLDGGIGASSLRFLALYAGRDDKGSATRLVVTLGGIVIVLTGVFFTAGWVLTPTFTQAFHVQRSYRPGASFLVRTVAPLVGFALLHNLFVAVLQSRHRFDFIARTTASSYLAWAAAVVAVVRYHQGLRGLALALLAQQALNTFWIVPASLRYLQHPDGRWLMSRSELRDFVHFSLRVQTTGLSTLVTTQFGGLAIGAVLGPVSAGVYQAGAGVALQVRTVAIGGLVPLASRLSNTFGRAGETGARDEFAVLQRLWVFAATGWVTAAAGVSYYGIQAWLGPRFDAGGVACTLLLVGFGVSLWTGTLVQYAAAVGKPEVDTRYGVFTSLLNVAGIMSLVWSGVVGAAAGSAAAFVIGGLYLLRVARARLGADIPPFYGAVPWSAAAACSATSFGVSALVRTVAPSGGPGLVCCGSAGLVGLAVYVSVVLGPRQTTSCVVSLLHRRLPVGLIDAI